MPLYLATDNITSAATIGTDKLWPGGTSGLNLSGSSNNVKGKLAIWDGGNLRSTHVEMNGRILQKDNADINDHATHVAGTLIASGVNPLAKGMSFGQQQLIAYNFIDNSDISEMMDEAPGLLLSNHSYGFPAGWNFNNDRWEYNGPVGSTEDYKFGYYSDQAQLWDSIAYNAPYYLMVKSAGNSREQNGPAVGETYWRRNAAGTFISGTRPSGISNNDSYDIIPTTSTAKNILTVGAVNPISNGYNRPQDVIMSSFSNWGPTDDGRIKPDVVANGLNVLSTIATTNTAYDIYTGTSMATPSATGSLLLLQEYYSQLHGGTFMRSATLKGLAIHTADEAGPSAGPDYRFGWGLLNVQKAADVITANNTTQLIQEKVLNNSGTFSMPVIASGNGTLSATISWTDVIGAVVPETNALDNTTKKLVNDLDIVIKKGATFYRPWILTPGVPAAAATRGNNLIDNVEKVELPDIVPGETYTIEITHKGTLARGAQAYSLIVSGVGSQPYCASAATSTAGSKIDSVSFSNIKKKNVAGCTSYNNYTTLTGNVEPGQIIPLFVRLTSCDASTADKVVKVYIDANSDGDFTDAGENIATSAVINGDGDFSTNITLPVELTAGKYSILRIVMQETNSAAVVNPCGNYIRGETQDYRIFVAKPSTDVGIVELVSPVNSECPSGEQFITVRIRNFGSSAKSNIPVSVTVKQGATTIASISENFPGTIAVGADVIYTLQTPFKSAENADYTITSTTSMTGDQDPSNNQNITTVNIAPNSSDPSGTAVICGNNVQLRATAANAADVYTWYNSSTATIPIATGANTTTTLIETAYYLGKNDVSHHVGPANKLVFPDGGYNVFDGNRVIINCTKPATIETARLYIGQPGKITFHIRNIVSFDEVSGAYSYNPNNSTTIQIDAYATAPVKPVPGAQNNDPADKGAIYYLGLPMPVAGDYWIFIESTEASIFRNNNISINPYPFTFPGVFSITGNGTTLAGDPNNYQKFYYFFYDIAVKLNSCPSDRVTIIPTTATAPIITQTGNELSSNTTTGNQWYLNGIAIAGATGQTHTATASGKYTVQTTTTGCTLPSNEINLVLTAIPNIDPSEIGLIVSPNPSPAGQFHIILETRTRADLDISLINTIGQKVYRDSKPGFVGRLSQLVNPGKIAPGVYYLRIVHDKKMYVKKIVVLE